MRGGAGGRGRAESETERHAQLSPPPPHSPQTHCGRKGEGGGEAKRGRSGRNACVENKQKQGDHLGVHLLRRAYLKLIRGAYWVVPFAPDAHRGRE